MRRPTQLKFIVAFLAAAVSIASAQDRDITSSTQQSNDSRKSNPQLAFDTLELPKTFDQQPYLKGIAKPYRVVELAAKVDGLIAKVFVKEGETVTHRQLLVLIEDEAAKASVKIAEIEAKQTGEVDRAELDWQLENQRFQRLQSVVSNNATSELELWEKAALRDQKKAILEEAKEKTKLAAAKLERSIADWNRHKIFASFDGQVIEIHKKSGTQPKSAEKIITIADLSQLEVELHLPLKHYGKIKKGGTVTLRADAPVGRELTSKVKAISSLINPTSETFRCVLIIDNQDLKLPAGFLVSAQLE